VFHPWLNVLKIPLATAERHWTYAHTWLYAELKNRGHSEKILRIFQRPGGVSRAFVALMTAK
jgi:hypothetical protein